MKQITINVDDLGLSASVNEAVVQLAHLQRIQSASLMSLGHVSAADMAALHAADCDIGLHFDLTALAKQSSLKTIVMRSWLRQWDVDKLQELVARQLDAFEDQVGLAPVFVDGHQHVHQFPQVRECLLAEVLRRYGNQVYWRNTLPLVTDVKSQVIYLLGGPTTAQLAHSQGMTMNGFFGGVYGFDGNVNALAERWQQWLAAAPPCGTLIMCHPAMPGAVWQDAIKQAREREWQWLVSDEFDQLWQRYGCVGQRWAQLGGCHQLNA